MPCADPLGGRQRGVGATGLAVAEPGVSRYVCCVTIQVV